MAIAKTTQTANRFGVDLKVWPVGTTTFDGEPLLTIDYVNEVSVELSGDTVWATGGQSHANKVPFTDPIEGTLTLSTQILTSELIALCAGEDMTTFSGNAITFNNHKTNTYYTITGSTVWKDKDGVTYSEEIVCYKAAPNRSYNVTYTGDGDPSSMDIVFNLTEDDDGNVYKATRADKT